MSGICKDCKWWAGPVATDSYEAGGHAKCNHEKVSAGAGQFTDGCSDSEGYGGVYAGPDFGCIHFEQRSEA